MRASLQFNDEKELASAELGSVLGWEKHALSGGIDAGLFLFCTDSEADAVHLEPR